ncbi:non-specific lipid-transfer protein-like protein At2g13820 [Cucurbita moschata]|uniref:Non-specific lipid-transfer protein-like protein At2g13820 n=1 Tax=Cucurbita moschata TaxID=3662 RepID=A0A6J1GTV8_CUCMO|nr:non-specific lipid-transfer protein-like protein At2g13820 [Cucurbita moschata]XP_022955413.1 non-specific lipid-transfer protein-like protein At2g13820 [Cucurbita moschata]XP_022955414.1 non-specific lipid-transfer protein-like protein At2g13820 [Cucurbita moschata]
MEPFVPLARAIPVLALAFAVAVLPVLGQINSPCNPSMIARFTPCMNLLTNSTANGTSPTASCCDYLRSLTGTGMDCLCLIVTASVPFQLPINRSLAISLPRACNMPGVPVQCRASAAPIPAPGPISLGPALSPDASPTPLGSGIPQPATPAQSPEADTTEFLTPPETPTTTTDAGTGISPELTPSSATISTYNFYLLGLALSCMVSKLY